MNHHINFGKIRLLLCLVFFISPQFGLAQWNSQFSNAKGIGLGLTLKGNGFGLAFQKNSVTKEFNLQRTFSIDLVTSKHPREFKIVNQGGAPNPTPYVYGKIYHTAFTRLGYGYRKTLIMPTQNNTLGIDLMVVAGPTVGVQRPVYLDIMTFEMNDQVATIRSQKFMDNVNIQQDDIVGYSRASKGWNEMKYTPGVGIKPSINIYWGSFETSVKQLNIGTMIDFFPSGIQVMAFGENPKTYTKPYLSFLWSFNR